MRRLQVASLLTLVLALTGGFAATSRPADTSRVAVSIAWFEATPAKPPARRHAFQAPPNGPVRVSPVLIAQTPIARSALITYSLFQRPPPAIRT